MPRWLIRPVTHLMLKCAWLLGLNYMAMLPVDDEGVYVVVVLAPSKEAYAAAYERAVKR